MCPLNASLQLDIIFSGGSAEISDTVSVGYDIVRVKDSWISRSCRMLSVMLCMDCRCS